MPAASATFIRGRSILAILALPMALAGCTATSSKPPASAESVRLYENKQFERAYEQSTAKANDRDLDFAQRQQAQLVAGLSAYELDRYDEAKRLLGPLTTSADRKLGGQAAAGLGLAHIATQNYDRAVEYLNQAGRQLEGDEGARANLFAGDCNAVLGRVQPARTAYQLALAQAKDQTLYTQIQRKLSTEGYTVQLGAFSKRENADRAAASFAATAKRAGLPPPTVVVDTVARGRTLYVVQTGRFKSLNEAQSAKSRLGTDSVVRELRAGQ